MDIVGLCLTFACNDPPLFLAIFLPTIKSHNTINTLFLNKLYILDCVFQNVFLDLENIGTTIPITNKKQHIQFRVGSHSQELKKTRGQQRGEQCKEKKKKWREMER